jgi:hypothetical protein
MVKVLLAALLVGIGLVGVVAASWPAPSAEVEPPVAREPEKPWFTSQALRQVIDLEHGLGPLFEGSTVGGSAPSKETRARIAAFAKAHDVTIELDIKNDELRSVTLDIVFGGCCGYEGVDVMARGLGRPFYSESCGAPGTYIDNWRVIGETTAMRATIRVNRLTLFVEPSITEPVLIARVDALLGMRIDDAMRGDAAHWRELGDGRYLFEQPIAFMTPEIGAQPGIDRMDLGARVTAEDGVITRVVFSLRELDSDATTAAMTAQWGTPKQVEDDRIWSKRDRVITNVRWQRSIEIAKR